MQVELLALVQFHAHRSRGCPQTHQQRLDLGLHDDSCAARLHLAGRTLVHGDFRADGPQFVRGRQTAEGSTDDQCCERVLLGHGNTEFSGCE
nr:hypothetical protein [Saccharopolyspora shandongensis]